MTEPTATFLAGEESGPRKDPVRQLLSRLDAESRADEPPLALGTYPDELISRRLTEQDVTTLFAGVDAELVTWRAGGRFDTLDRPLPPRGRWWLIERDGSTRRPCWEFVPQLAAYVELIRHLGYHRHRVLFDTPAASLQLDLAVLDDASRVVVLGEAKKESRDLDRLEAGLPVHEGELPEPKRGDEPRQLAWRLWTTRAPYLWLVGPSDRRAYRVSYEPLLLEPIEAIPQAVVLRLNVGPEEMMSPPDLRTSPTQ